MPSGVPVDVSDGALPSGLRIATDVALFHDASEAAGGLSGGEAGLSLRLASFDGSYLSFAIDLPPPVLPLLTRSRIFEAAAAFENDPGMSGWLRVNLRSGQAVTRSVGSWTRGAEGMRAGIDLAAFTLPATPDHAWAEVIFDCARPATISIRELVFWLAPRGRF